MTECNFFSNGESNIICRACLSHNDTIQPISLQEVNWYEIVTQKIQITQDMILMCVNCRHLLKKFAMFARRCQDAEQLFHSIVQQDKPALSLQHHLSFSPVNYVYFGPESDFELEPPNEDHVDHNSDDDLPLVLLSKGDKSRVKKRKKRKRDVEMTESQAPEELDSELVAPASETNAKKKVLRDGFSSRMVQETDEYLVIKLNKEQVLQELEERRATEKYKRALYKCELCAKGFNFEDVLSSHMEKHSKENGAFPCDICTQHCPSAVSLRGHMKSHTTRYQCKVCAAVRLSRQHLLEHHGLAHAARAAHYACRHCQFTTDKRTVIQRHVRSHAARERLACSRCGRLFRGREALRVHLARHDASSRLQCAHCPRRFIFPSLLQRHERSVHLARDYYCVECDVSFKSPDNLRLHFKKAKKHRDPSSYTHNCPTCGLLQPSAAALAAHAAAAHGEPKRHRCELCRRGYGTRESLRGHIRRVHVPRQPSQTCHVCKKSFSRKSILAVHIRSHHAEVGNTDS